MIETEPEQEQVTPEVKLSDKVPVAVCSVGNEPVTVLDGQVPPVELENEPPVTEMLPVVVVTPVIPHPAADQLYLMRVMSPAVLTSNSIASP